MYAIIYTNSHKTLPLLTYVIHGGYIMKKIVTALKILAIFLILAVLLHISFFLLFTHPANGRKHTLHIVDTIYMQDDVPKEKLIKYMNKKYGLEFTEVEVTRENALMLTCSTNYEYWYNGIAVETESYPDSYFNVQDHYGEIRDNFFCYLNIEPATDYLKNKITEYTGYECKLRIEPSELQNTGKIVEILPNEYVNTVNYKACILLNTENINKNIKDSLEQLISDLDVKNKKIRFYIFFCRNENFSESSSKKYHGGFSPSEPKYYLLYRTEDGEINWSELER